MNIDMASEKFAGIPWTHYYDMGVTDAMKLAYENDVTVGELVKWFETKQNEHCKDLDPFVVDLLKYVSKSLYEVCDVLLDLEDRDVDPRVRQACDKSIILHDITDAIVRASTTSEVIRTNA